MVKLFHEKNDDDVFSQSLSCFILCYVTKYRMLKFKYENLNDRQLFITSDSYYADLQGFSKGAIPRFITELFVETIVDRKRVVYMHVKFQTLSL